MMIRPGELEITPQSSEEGEGQEFVPAEYTAEEEVPLGFNWQYLQEFLTNRGALEGTATVTDPDSTATASDPNEPIKETDGDKVRVKESKGATRVSFEFKDANAATQISIAGDSAYDYKYIVMPLRI
jgi:DNA polymerase III sliding clamp (beta) subunit (PCNA family)